MMIIEGTKEESRLIRWLQKAQSDDAARPILTGLHVTEDYVIACDGFRLHATPTPLCLQLARDKQVKGKVPAGDFAANMEEVEGTYPDIFQVMPNSEATFAVAVDPKYLREALQGVEGYAVLRFRSPDTPIEVFDQYGKHYAVIMPRHQHPANDPKVGGWRPEDAKARIRRKLAHAEKLLAERTALTDERDRAFAETDERGENDG